MFKFVRCVFVLRDNKVRVKVEVVCFVLNVRPQTPVLSRKVNLLICTTDQKTDRSMLSFTKTTK